ncbi:hypothetical protein G6038_27420 [Rhodococcus sp. 14C212]|uniref:hypothetical protein n=1 Tax=Rhodococcus sp. 14C212 TaxID=2711209 RepID=UPI0013EBB93F|nr:hypothetical protein [Rhodococcus sp. 14C212]
MAPRLVAAVAALTVGATVAGCSGMPGGVEGDLSRAAAQAASAAAAGQFALELVTDGRTTRNHAGTVLSDALDEVLSAYSAVAGAEVATESEAAHRSVLLDRLDATATVLGESRARTDSVADAPPAPELAAQLESLTGLLSAFAEGGR